MPLEFALSRNQSPVPTADRESHLANPGFGKVFTDHMVLAQWTPSGWGAAQVLPYGPLQIQPAAAVLHYAQEIFEGLKAYRHPDGTVWAFRPDRNGLRFQRSAERLALPQLPVEDFLASVKALVSADIDWVPSGLDGENSLYLRPYMFASEAFLGVRPALEVTYGVIASPAGAYFSGGVQPVSIWLSQNYTRAAAGGTGAAKCGGNYAAGLSAQLEATEHGCDQVCYLDAAEHRWVEELGGMNLFFVHADGRVLTPPTSGTILEGITRESVIELLRDSGHTVLETPVDIADWRADAASGELTEVFACGTAAVITPVGRLVWDGGQVSIGGGHTGPVTTSIREQLLDLQYGRIPDHKGWMHRLA